MTADALLAAVRADPGSDLPRLVYADHLDDAGDADRAEFIRVQCELAKLHEWDDRRPGLEDREHELLDRCEAAWLGNVPDGLTEWDWRRGFVDEITADLATLDTAGEAFAATHPFSGVTLAYTGSAVFPDAARRNWLNGLRRLNLTAPESQHRLLAAPELAGLTTLQLTDCMTAADVSNWLASAAFRAGLQELSVDGRGQGLSAPALARQLSDSPLTTLHLTNVGLDAVRPLLECPFAAELREFGVSRNRLWDDDLEAFELLPRDARLRHLDVSETILGGPFLGRLLGLPGLAGLTHLDMSRYDGHHAARMGEVRGSAFWRQAVSLRLTDSRLSTEAFKALVWGGGPPTLRLLDLTQNRLGYDGLTELLDRTWADSLTWLGVGRNRSRETGSPNAYELIHSGRFPRLRTLHLNNYYLDYDIESLTDQSWLSRLRLLNVNDCGLSGDDAVRLLNGPHWWLSGLGLARSNFDYESVVALAESSRLRRLNWLDLSDNLELGDDALMPLAESQHLSRLCELDIGGVGASDRVRDALRQRLGRRLSD